MTTDRSHLRFVVCLLAGLVPIVVVVFAYWLNLRAGLEGCNVLWDGCLSVSRAVRSGPGLMVFKVMALPMAAAMAWTWWRWPRPPAGRVIAVIGIVGAGALLVYAAGLGTEGAFYRWMRRYGVVFYFGLTGLAQLLLLRSLISNREGLWGKGRGRPSALAAYAAVIALTWCVGIVSAFKRRLSDDPAFVDRLQNVLEWAFAGGLSLAFVVLSWVILQTRSRRS